MRGWTLEEDDILRKCYPNLGLAARLLPNRTIEAIQRRSSGYLMLGLPASKPWSEPEEDLVRKLWGIHSTIEIAKILGRSNAAVKLHRLRMGLVGAQSVRKPVVPVHADIEKEAAKRRVNLKTLAKALGCVPLKNSPKGDKLNLTTVVRIVAAFGGEFYAEWDD